MANTIKIASGTFALKTIYLRVNNLRKTLKFFRELGWISIRSEVDDFDGISVYLQPSRHSICITLCISEHRRFTLNAVQFGLRAVNSYYVESLWSLHYADIRTKGIKVDAAHDIITYNSRLIEFENKTLSNFHVENITYEELRINHLDTLEDQYGGVDGDEADNSFMGFDDIYDGIGSTLRGIIIKVSKIDDYIDAFQQLGFELKDVKSEDGRIINAEILVNADAGIKLILQQDGLNLNNIEYKHFTFLVGGTSHCFDSNGLDKYSFIDELIEVAELKLNKKVLDGSGKVIPNHASYIDLNKFHWIFFDENKVNA